MKREKREAVGLVICFVAMIAIVGAITFANYNKKPQEAPSKKEEEQVKQEDPKKEEDKEEDSQITQGDNVQAEIPKPNYPIEKPLTFSEKDILLWPVDGNVLMNYSMDHTIYFATLEQYKYNPAILIQGQVGQDVRAAEEGKVVSIYKDAETGTTVKVELGDGYEVLYGQLQNVAVTQGERIAKGDVIGYLAEPTKYYSVEGCNLYFQMRKNGKPINPLEYLDV